MQIIQIIQIVQIVQIICLRGLTLPLHAVILFADPRNRSLSISLFLATAQFTGSPLMSDGGLGGGESDSSDDETRRLLLK